jgi:hypothetical protein
MLSAMQIYSAKGPATTAPAAVARRPTAGGFSLAEGDPARAGTPAAALRSVGGIDALLALQGAEDPTERRRRGVRRGKSALDVLDELKLGVLAGSLDRSTVLRLRSAAASLQDLSGDPLLDRLLAEIDLRVQVELAKLDPRG